MAGSGRLTSVLVDSEPFLDGPVLERLCERVLTDSRIRFQKRRDARRAANSNSGLVFWVPDKNTPSAVIYVSVAENGATAMATIDRVQRFANRSCRGDEDGEYEFEVVACIAGRGFGLDREGMKRLLLATRGKIFTLSTIDRLIECTRLKEFIAK